MLEPAVIIVASALLVKFFIFFPAIILYARKGKQEKQWVGPALLPLILLLQQLEKFPGGSHFYLTLNPSCCYCSSWSQSWTPSGLSCLSFLWNTLLHHKTYILVYLFYIYHISPTQASTTSPIFPQLLFELLPTLGAATLGVLQGAILRSTILSQFPFAFPQTLICTRLFSTLCSATMSARISSAPTSFWQGFIRRRRKRRWVEDFEI